MSTAPTRAGTGGGVLSGEQLASWRERGFFRVPRFAPPETCAAMLARVT